MLAQVVAVAAAVIVLMRDARAAGASAEGAGAAVLLAAMGALTSFTIARVQLFSLVLFPVLMALLRSDARAPSWRIWLALPLIALWSNLHGGVLIGVGVLVIYLAIARLRRSPLTAIGVGAGALVALCMTPAGLSTISYYRGLLGNQAAARGSGLWAPLSLTAPLDLLLIAVVIVLVLQLRKSRPALWELVVSAVLAVATIQAGRSGVWLVMFLAVPAAPGFRTSRWWNWVMPPLATAALIGLVVGLARGPLNSGAGGALVRRAVAIAHGTPILGDDIIDEQVALAGGRIWVGNPIDAFTKQDQLTYLNWLDGRTSGVGALRPNVDVVLTGSATEAHRLMAHDAEFERVATDGRADLYVRIAR